MSEQLYDNVRDDGKLYPPYFWTKDRLERLRRLASEGLTATQISIELGCTKNMVIGKCFRSDIDLLYPPKTPIKAYPPTPNPFPGRGCCVWPMGDPGQPGFRFCGERGSPNHRSYCRAHAKVARRKTVLAESMI